MIYACDGCISNIFLLINANVQKNVRESYPLLRNRSLLEVHEGAKQLMDRFIPKIIYLLYSELITRMLSYNKASPLRNIKYSVFLYLPLIFRQSNQHNNCNDKFVSLSDSLEIHASVEL